MDMTTHTYATRPERALELDVFAPARPNGAAILLLHGGALLVGERAMTHPYADALTRHGFAVIAVSYRLRTEALWPASLDDAKAAYAWVREHAEELNIDPAKIVLEGFSAGAMLSLLAAPSVGAAAVVAFFPPAEAARDPATFSHLGAHLTSAEIDASAPLAAIAAGYPPTLILHGVEDATIPVDAALALFQKLRSVGAKADLRLYHDHVHEFSIEPSMIAPIQADVALFLNRAVVAPERYAEESRRHNPFLNGKAGGPMPRARRA